MFADIFRLSRRLSLYIYVYSIGLRHSADPFTFREQRFQSFSARLQVYQGRFRDFLRALEPAPEALGGVLEPSWSHFGPSNEHPQYPMVKTRVQELSQSTFLKDVSNGIMVLEGAGGPLSTPSHPPPKSSARWGGSGGVNNS